MIGLSERVVTFLGNLIGGDDAALIQELESIPAEDAAYASLFRLAVFHTSRSPLYYRRLLNQWNRQGCPPLKPAPRATMIEILADGTVNGLEPYLKLFCAPYGLNATVVLGDFDAVEQQAFGEVDNSTPDFTLVVFSDYWLQRQLGTTLPSSSQIDTVKALLDGIIEGFKQRRRGHLVFASLTAGAFPPPASSVSTSQLRGWSLAIAEINLFMSQRTNARVHLLDTTVAMQLAGGNAALGNRNFLRARAPFEEAGFIALAREAATGIAQLTGRSHRALLTDWDNTLWEGEVGELGVHAIVCGQDSPDALGYYLLQVYLKNLHQQGVLLAAVSRNDPANARVLEENKELALRREHFACLALSWGSKCDSIRRIQNDFKFGPEFMLYIDDSPVDLADVLVTFPAIDLVPAGPTPEATLHRLIHPRFFNALCVTAEDLERPLRAMAFVQQERVLADAPLRDDFLASLNMHLYVSDLDCRNLERVLQLLQKTNQFNLTTRRHTETDLISLRKLAARFGVFRYVDRFGSQGIVGLIILVPEAGSMNIDTWLMSCRVLNRNVERAMFEWAKQQASGIPITGRYIATKKNGIVKDLYPSLSFEVVARGDQTEYVYHSLSENGTQPLVDLIYE
jgi:FkbH-like protein